MADSEINLSLHIEETRSNIVDENKAQVVDKT